MTPQAGEPGVTGGAPWTQLTCFGTYFIGPEGYSWQAYTDPVGHPFCLCRHEGVPWTDKGVVWPWP